MLMVFKGGGPHRVPRENDLKHNLSGPIGWPSDRHSIDTPVLSVCLHKNTKIFTTLNLPVIRIGCKAGLLTIEIVGNGPQMPIMRSLVANPKLETGVTL